MPHPLAPLRLCRSRASARPALRLFLFQFLVSIFLYAFVKRTRSSQKTSRIKGSMVRIKYKVVGGRQGDQSYHHGSFPPITVLQDEMREHIAPWDKGDKNNNHQAGFYIFCRRRIYLVGGP